jgi:hypothetical protein
MVVTEDPPGDAGRGCGLQQIVAIGAESGRQFIERAPKSREAIDPNEAAHCPTWQLIAARYACNTADAE